MSWCIGNECNHYLPHKKCGTNSTYDSCKSSICYGTDFEDHRVKCELLYEQK